MDAERAVSAAQAMVDARPCAVAQPVKEDQHALVR